MKFIHLSDLHIGKRLNNYSLVEDQRHIFGEILEKTRDFAPDFTLIAGDVFDRSVPSEEAVSLYDELISELSSTAPVYMISGNHDGRKRLELFSKQLRNCDIFIEGCYKGKLHYEEQQIGNECARIYMLPYVSPAEVRAYHEEVRDYESMLKTIIDTAELDNRYINILVSHQFFLNHASEYDSLQVGSERPVVGGMDAIHTKFIKDFDYVALGHVHGMKNIGSERIRYAGTPMKYATSEYEKNLSCITLSKDEIKIDPVPLHPLRDVREIVGTLEELEQENSDDYVSIRLTDEKTKPHTKARLLKHYPNLLDITYSEHFTTPKDNLSREILKLNPLDLLKEFYKSSGKTLTKEEESIAQNILKKVADETT